MEPIAVLVTHRIRTGRRDEVRSIWKKHLAPAINANPGHLAYTYCFDETDPDVICAFQLYADGDQAAAFRRTEAYMAYEAAVAPLLDGPPAVKRLTPVWTKVAASDR